MDEIIDKFDDNLSDGFKRSFENIREKSSELFTNPELCHRIGKKYLSKMIELYKIHKDDYYIVKMGTPFHIRQIFPIEVAFQTAIWTFISCDRQLKYRTNCKIIIGQTLRKIINCKESLHDLDSIQIFDLILGPTLNHIFYRADDSFYPDIILSLIRCMLIDNNCYRFAPYHDREYVTIQSLRCDIFSYVSIFVIIMDRYINRFPGHQMLNFHFQLPYHLIWYLDNPDDPVTRYLRDNGYPTEKYCNLSCRQYCDIIDIVFDIDQITKELHTSCHISSTLDALSWFLPSLRPNVVLIASTLVKQFMMRNQIINYSYCN